MRIQYRPKVVHPRSESSSLLQLTSHRNAVVLYPIVAQTGPPASLPPSKRGWVHTILACIPSAAGCRPILSYPTRKHTQTHTTQILALIMRTSIPVQTTTAVTPLVVKLLLPAPAYLHALQLPPLLQTSALAPASALRQSRASRCPCSTVRPRSTALHHDSTYNSQSVDMELV